MKKTISLLIITAILFAGCAYYPEIVKAPDTALYNQTVIFNNAQYVPLLRFCNYYNLVWDWDLVSGRIEVKRGKNTLILRPDSTLALANGKAIEFDYPIEYKDGAAYVPVKTALYISEKVLGLKERPAPAVGRYTINTIVIDPGHGGRKDIGAKGKYGAKEKHIVLDISKRLKKYLEKNGLKVILTRSRDVAVPLYKRAAIANENNADFFISVHANGSRHRSASGFEVFYVSEATDDKARALAALENKSLNFENGEISKKRDSSTKTTVWELKLTEARRQSRELAYYICNIVSDELGMRNRGVKGARFVVLKGALMPAVLVEVGFLTNRREESKLKSSSFRDSVAQAIARSILAYKKEYERTDGFSR